MVQRFRRRTAEGSPKGCRKGAVGIVELWLKIILLQDNGEIIIVMSGKSCIFANPNLMQSD